MKFFAKLTKKPLAVNYNTIKNFAPYCIGTNYYSYLCINIKKDTEK